MLWPEFESFWDPWKEFEEMRGALRRAIMPVRAEFPPVNVWVKEDGTFVTMEIPGIDKGSIDISVEGNSLVLRGARKPVELKESEAFHRRERWHNCFSKAVALPFNIETDKVEAKYSRGVLNIVLPRAETERPRKIAIKSE